MRSGDIFLHKQFAFRDGGVADKFFVVLGESSGILVAAKTTSKGHRYRNEHGCQAGSYFAAFMLTRGCCVLAHDTWVCLSEFYEFTLNNLTSKLVSGTVYAHGSLNEELTLDVQFCAAGCDDISQNQEKAVRDSIAKLKVERSAKSASLLGQLVAHSVSPSTSINTTSSSSSLDGSTGRTIEE
jgi:hypothetical protein